MALAEPVAPVKPSLTERTTSSPTFAEIPVPAFLEPTLWLTTDVKPIVIPLPPF